MPKHPPAAFPALLALALGLASLSLEGSAAFAQQVYQKPPKEITALLNAPPTPLVALSPTRERLLLVQGERYPPIADLAEPFLRLAGLRINPVSNGPHAQPRIVGLTLVEVADGTHKKLALPADPRLTVPHWSPDGKHFAFTHTGAAGVELWLGEAATGVLRHVPELRVNAVYGEPLHWMPDGKQLLCLTAPPTRGKPPQAPRVPNGPIIQESFGKPSPVRTFQDLLQDAHDEKLFDYYTTSQLTLVDVASLRITAVGWPAIFRSVAPSPDGRYLLVTRHHRPYSYLVPVTAFPQAVEVWDRTGKVVHQLRSVPLAEQVPIEGVPTGPRHCHWQPAVPATLVWVQALDDGDPQKLTPHRDVIVLHAAPFTAAPVLWHKTEHRFAAITWGETPDTAFVRDYDRERRWQRTFLLGPSPTKPQARLVWSVSVQDRYKDPGHLALRTLPTGQQVFCQRANRVYLIGEGASPRGAAPFLVEMDLETFETKRLFQSAEGSYETVLALLADDASRLLTRHESPLDPPNYFVRQTGAEAKKALTQFVDPVPQFHGSKRKLVTYKRADGVSLSMTLYLPPGHKEGERLPAVLWAYPREYVDASTAGQVVGSPHRFTRISGPSHLFFLTQGYAVLHGASMPVVGDPATVNNTYVEQIVSSARAAIAKADELGVIDPRRVGVGGHSYGAFMTANLLAHSDLFRAGIARSGAYNRTLTPFGFQHERRTLWEAPEMYFKVSPFLHVAKIKAPLLLIHGEADNNPGTFPMQSERMYHALKGTGGHVRYVALPHEGHGYIARESVEHTLWEMIAWFDRFVKNAPVPD